MIDRYYSVKDVMEALQVSKSRAYEIVYEMPRLEHPLRVSERVLKTWLEQNTVYPMGKGRRSA